MARHLPDAFGVGRVFRQALVARHGLKVVKAQLDADGFAFVAFALQIGRYLFAEPGENGPEFFAVAHSVQVALKRGFAAHADGFALGLDRAVIAAPGGLVQPGAVAFAKVVHQPGQLACGQVADGVDAKALELFIGLGAHAVDLAAGQRPDQGLQVGLVHDGDAVGLVELAGHLGDQLVGGHADRAGQARGVKNAFLDQPGQHAPAFALAAGHVGEVDVDLVHAAVLHDGCDVGDDAFEGARKVSVTVKIHRQQDGLRAELGGFHQPHGRADAKLPGRIGGGGDHAAPGVAFDAREKVDRDAVQPLGKGVFGPFALGVGRPQLAQQVIFFSAATANDDR